MPVPSAASVSLGDAEVFDELRRLTAPRVEYRDSWWPTFTWLSPARHRGEAGAPARCGVERARSSADRAVRCHPAGRQRPDRIGNMVGGQGISASRWLDANLAPYVADGWEIVAIQLVPAEQGDSLTGDLQPLRLSFASDKSSTRCACPARRRCRSPSTCISWPTIEWIPTAVPVAGGQPSLEFAGRIERADVSPALAPLCRATARS